jgi:ornithine cyclodeaminase/alanine dehydrogenase-like protein (mu-crystallin family)
MSGTVLQLRSHEVWRALEVVDPVETMAEYLIGRTVGRVGPGSESAGRLVSWRGAGRNGTELVLLDHPDATGPCVLPAQSLRSSQVAALAAVAAREMLVSGGVTMALLGPATDTQPQLSVVARYVPDISHVALFGGPETCLEHIEPRLADQLELSGIQLSVAASVADAVFGANLVIATSHATAALDLADLRPSQLARGALLINATGEDLPTDIVERVDQVFVDELGLLENYPHRHVVGAHRADPRIAGDLAQLLTDQHAGRRRSGDLVLVELLGVHELNADLAFRIYEVATQTGLGVRIAN